MRLVMISGDAASGKTTSIMKLDPKSTFVLSPDSKGLSWVGWRKTYNRENKNYAEISTTSAAAVAIKKIHDTMPHIKVIVLDTVSTLMSNAEMEILKNPSRDQWADLASEVYELFKMVREMSREDLTTVVMGHLDYFEVNGVMKSRLKTNGKKLTKLNLNSFLNYHLVAEVNATDEGLEYTFVTRSDGTNEARAPLGMFEARIPNDLKFVIDTINEKE